MNTIQTPKEDKYYANIWSKIAIGMFESREINQSLKEGWNKDGITAEEFNTVVEMLQKEMGT